MESAFIGFGFGLSVIKNLMNFVCVRSQIDRLPGERC